MRQEVGEIFRVIADDETGGRGLRDDSKCIGTESREIIMVADWHAVNCPRED